MEHFKQQCRAILAVDLKTEKDHRRYLGEDEEYSDEESDIKEKVLLKEYEVPLDIITAYKSLKQAV